MTIENEETTEKEEVRKEPDSSETGKKKRKRKRKRKAQTEGEDDGNETKDTTVDAVDAEEQTKLDQLDRTVYVEGIPFHVKEADVRQFFGNDGIVECRLPVFQDTGRLMGYGHVVLDSKESYDAALAKSGEYLERRYLKVEPAKRPKNHAAEPGSNNSEPSATVALHNLAYSAVEEDVQQVMEKFGLIVEGGVRVVRHSGTGQSKGFGYVEYESIESAKAAVTAAPIRISGRPCRMDYDHGRVKGSFRMADRTLWQQKFGKKSRAS